jgi:hypothetical protein
MLVMDGKDALDTGKKLFLQLRYRETAGLSINGTAVIIRLAAQPPQDDRLRRVKKTPLEMAVS